MMLCRSMHAAWPHSFAARGAVALFVAAVAGCSYDDEGGEPVGVGPATTVTGTYVLTMVNGQAAPTSGPGSADMVFQTDGSATEHIRMLDNAGTEVTTTTPFQYTRQGTALYLDFGGHVDTSTIANDRIDVLEANTAPRESRSYVRQ